jgi:hypothetical protein
MRTYYCVNTACRSRVLMFAWMNGGSRSKAVAAAQILLPRTEMVHGHASNPASHFYFRAGNVSQNLKFLDPRGSRECVGNRSTIIELRVNGQTVVPPSTNQRTGEPVIWELEGEPANVNCAKTLCILALGITMRMICEYGEMWPRNEENIRQIPKKKGVYVLYDGSMPMYVGKGILRRRIGTARKGKYRGQFWDHFSWYVLKNPRMIHDTESLLLRTLPPYLRSRTKQKGGFTNARRIRQPRENRHADLITRRVMV